MYCFVSVTIIALYPHQSPSSPYAIYNLLTFFSSINFIIGVVGDSNSLCSNTTASSQGIASVSGLPLGAACFTDANCLYGFCSMNTCAAPALSCPTTLPGMRLPLLIPLVQESNYPLFSFITSYSILSKPFFC